MPMSNPTYKGTQITVPWAGPVFAYPTSGYITNAELDLLELRFWKQSEILASHGLRAAVQHKIKAAGMPYFNDEKVAEITDRIAKIKLRRYIHESGRDGCDVFT